ncbi:MAG: cupin domain-containing protein [Clostridiales bacterium]
MTKRLISVIDIKTLSQQGQKELCLGDGDLITPAARDAAVEFGVKIVKGAAPQWTATVANPQASPLATPAVAAGAIVTRSEGVSSATQCPPVPGYREGKTLITSPWPEVRPTSCSVTTQPTPSANTTPWLAANPVAFDAISGGNSTVSTPVVPSSPCIQGVDNDLVAQIVQQVMAQMNGGIAPNCPPADLVRAIDPQSGFMLIKGNSVKLEPFNDGEKDRPGIWIKEYSNPQESANMTAGIMEFDHADLNWTLTYDEWDYVIDGTLEFIVNGKKYTGYPGDSFYIPANTTVTFTTPDKTKFFFVTYPANWAEMCK